MAEVNCGDSHALDIYEQRIAEKRQQNKAFLDSLEITGGLEPQNKTPKPPKRSVARFRRQTSIESYGTTEDDHDTSHDHNLRTREVEVERRMSARLLGKPPRHDQLLEDVWYETDSDVLVIVFQERKYTTLPPKARRLGHRRVGSGRQQVARTKYTPYHDSVNGTSCHQCRQKTIHPKVRCTEMLEKHSSEGIVREECGYMLDKACLEDRYGQDFDKIRAHGTWKCPMCRGVCNCSFCRMHQNKDPTGILKHRVTREGFLSAHHYLKWHENKTRIDPQDDPFSLGYESSEAEEPVTPSE
jgi:hypothetical protein